MVNVPGFDTYEEQYQWIYDYALDAFNNGVTYIPNLGITTSVLSYYAAKVNTTVNNASSSAPGGGNVTGAAGGGGGLSTSRSSVMVNKQSNNEPIPVLYGKQRMGGTRVFVASSNGAGSAQEYSNGEYSNTEYLNLVIAIAEGTMGDVQEVYFNEQKVWDSSLLGTFATGRGANQGQELLNFEEPYELVSGMRMFYYNGTTSQAHCAELTASIASWGPSAYDSPTLSEIAYIAIILPADEVFGGTLPTVTCVLEGKKILDITNMTEGTAAYTTEVTGADQNPADVLYDYLTSDKFGKGLDRNYTESGGVTVSSRNRGRDIDLASFKAAKIHCDAARQGNGYPFNGFLPTGARIFDNVANILAMCNGLLLFIDGKYHLKIKRQGENINMPDHAVFTKDDILSPIVLTMPSKTTKLNKAIGVYGGSGTDWNDDLVVYSPFTYLEEDNLTVLEHKQDFSLITNRLFVTDLIEQRVDYSRVMQAINLTVSHRGMQLRAGDVIDVRHEHYGWGIDAGLTQKIWRIQEISINEDNTVELTATAYESGLEL